MGLGIVKTSWTTVILMQYVQMPLKHIVFFWQTMAMLYSQVTKYYSIRILSHSNGKNLLKPLLEYTVNQLFLKIKALWNMNLYRLRQRWCSKTPFIGFLITAKSGYQGFTWPCAEQRAALHMLYYCFSFIADTYSSISSLMSAVASSYVLSSSGSTFAIRRRSAGEAHAPAFRKLI